MADVENEQEVVAEAPALEVEAPAAAIDETPAGESAAEEKPVKTGLDRIAEMAAAKETPGSEATDEEKELAKAGEDAGYKPNLKFKAGVFNKESKALEQKDFDIDPKFHAIMKDPESEKMVRELHEKAYGLQSVKERFEISRQENQFLFQKTQGMVSHIEDLRNTYQGAVQSGNFLKLANFFKKLDIPEEHILKYALAKVQLQEAPEEQRNAILAQQKAENDAESLAQQQRDMVEQNTQNAIQMKQMMLDHTLARVEVAPLAQAYDERVGTPGAFKELVRKEGLMAWHTEKVDLTPQQAVERAIKNYGLDTGKHGLPPAKKADAETSVANPSANGKKAVVKRSTQTIPNLQGRSTSPLAGKPKNLEEVVKYRKEVHGI